MLHLYNTLTKKIEPFSPLHDKKVGMYACGPTVYNFAHIGNLRAYVFEDILKRILLFNGYKVKHVMNITDVGHLTSDADEGEDKMEKGAKREGKTAWEIAKFYTKAFKENISDLNILAPDIWCKATEHIKEQIALVQKLIDKGLTYETSDGIYFDTTKINDYGKLAGLQKQDLKAGARTEMGEKKNPHDFALWKFSPAGEKRQMEWKAFGKMGFPGWHIECSAMSMKYLGEQFDIHCGGIDHIPVHHTNEIAQSEAVTGKKPWVKYWLHGEFLIIANPSTNSGQDTSANAQHKMSKSADNFITLQTLSRHSHRLSGVPPHGGDGIPPRGGTNINPLSYRYLLLQTHYRKQLTFTWEALGAAQRGLEHLYEEALGCHSRADGNPEIATKFLETINDDLDTPKALAIVWEGLKKKQISYKTLLKFDEVLGLGMEEIKKLRNKEIKIPTAVKKLIAQRQKARAEKNWTESDKLREEIKKMGFEVEDTGEGQKIVKS